MEHHRAFAVFQKIVFGACRSDRGRDRFAADDIEAGDIEAGDIEAGDIAAGDQTQRTVPDVFELDPLFPTGSHLFFGAMRSRAWMPVISSIHTVCVSN